MSDATPTLETYEEGGSITAGPRPVKWWEMRALA